METIGFVGVGRIGTPICAHLITAGYRVVGWRRSSLAAFEKMGGVPARTPADVGREAGIVFSCVPSVAALDAVVQGEQGLVHTARPGQIVIELGSHTLVDKERQIAPLAQKGAIFMDGEVAGTPAMVAARKGAIYLAGDAEAYKKIEPVTAAFADTYLYFGAFGCASKVKLINNHLVGIHLAATAEAMALGLKAGVDVDLLIKAVAAGSGGSTQFNARAPMIAAKRYTPVMGAPSDFFPYFHKIHELAASVDTATPLLDRAMEIHQRALDTGYGDLDNAALVEVINAWPRKQ